MNCEPLEFEKPVADLERQLNDLRERSEGHDLGLENEIRRIEEKLAKTKMDIYRNLNAWQRVQIARHPQRPFMLDYVGQCFSDYLELHGDRHIGDDESMPGGFGWLEGRRCVVVGHQKGRDTKENLRRNFGSAHPEGYRKALRLMRLGEKFGAPVVALIDTPGAYPGIGAEERNIAEAIAYNLREMMLLRVPIVAVVIGEGGSGGALGIGIADRVLMMENAYYSVISPEGCAGILWKSHEFAEKAAEALRFTSGHLREYGIVDDVIEEPLGGAHRDHHQMANRVKQYLLKQLRELNGVPGEQLVEQRYEKFRRIGVFLEAPPVNAAT
ncbi:MAG: acetyl-CoA carboxylase carboxyltransferase subunit alpha [Verrucomicrobiae bacterium]|nr:acetyl-CoA carboxylase carboxyltransferase subunit alpha [Verrucomicrobiae bacterium]